jgi:hypothetical protein
MTLVAEMSSKRHALAGCLEYQFTEFSLSYVLMHASRICAAKQFCGTKEKKNQKSRASLDLIYVGALGEYAVARTFGLKLDTKLYRVRDDGHDMETEDGRTIQVKCITYGGPDPNLNFFEREEFKSTYAVLTRADTPTHVTIIGWIRQDEFMGVTKNYGYGPRSTHPASSLHPADSFRAELAGF